MYIFIYIYIDLSDRVHLLCAEKRIFVGYSLNKVISFYIKYDKGVPNSRMTKGWNMMEPKFQLGTQAVDTRIWSPSLK